nr:hypothetical protein [Belnapia sp. F-4-1]
MEDALPFREGVAEKQLGAAGLVDHPQLRPQDARLLRQDKPAVAEPEIEVGHQHVDGLRLVRNDSQRILGIVRLKEVEPDRLEEIGEGETHHGVVLDQQHRHPPGPSAT